MSLLLICHLRNCEVPFSDFPWKNLDSEVPPPLSGKKVFIFLCSDVRFSSVLEGFKNGIFFSNSPLINGRLKILPHNTLMAFCVEFDEFVVDLVI